MYKYLRRSTFSCELTSSPTRTPTCHLDLKAPHLSRREQVRRASTCCLSSCEAQQARKSETSWLLYEDSWPERLECRSYMTPVKFRWHATRFKRSSIYWTFRYYE